jgi:methylation protein EvaC
MDCRVCGGTVEEFLDLGRQPISQCFPRLGDTAPEFFFRLAAGQCASCRMVQQVEEVPRELMFHAGYPFHTSSSRAMVEHFQGVARELLRTELAGAADPFMVELGCNDGAMLDVVRRAGVRHFGFEPSAQVAAAARAAGVRVGVEFFEEATAKALHAAEGPADVIFAANTVGHLPYLDSVLRGVDALLAPGGVFVFEDPYLGDAVTRTAFDQFYDEHFYLFTAASVRAAARRFGLELVDVRRLSVHGGQVRFTLARAGARPPRPAVARLLTQERQQGLCDLATLHAFARRAAAVRDDLVALLRRLRDRGHLVVGYGATAKSATVNNFCGIGPELVRYVCDTTPGKHGRLTPGTHIPIRPPAAFADPYPDYALLYAWPHTDAVFAREGDFRRAGGRWIRYVPAVRAD